MEFLIGRLKNASVDTDLHVFYFGRMSPMKLKNFHGWSRLLAWILHWSMARTPMVWPPTTTSSRRSQCPRGQRPWHARKLCLLQKQSLGCHPIQGTIASNHEERERRNCLLWKNRRMQSTFLLSRDHEAFRPPFCSWVQGRTMLSSSQICNLLAFLLSLRPVQKTFILLSLCPVESKVHDNVLRDKTWNEMRSEGNEFLDGWGEPLCLYTSPEAWTCMFGRGHALRD
jgi:hypothetical protein